MSGLQHAVDKLRDAGYKITKARMTVLEVLQQNGGHLTSTNVLEKVEMRDATIGRASVFRTLELLTELSIIRPTYLESRTPTYVLLTGEGHHSHIICVNCNRVIELDTCQVDDLAKDFEQRYNVHITGHLLEFYSVCDACLKDPDTNP